MTGIRPFGGYLVDRDLAPTIVSPAYDSVSPQQRRMFAEANPDNFINTMRLLEDFSAADRPTTEQLLDLNRRHLDKLLANGSYHKLHQPCMFIYRLSTGAHVQTGVVCEVAVAEYEREQIRRHENTRTDKEDLLTRYQETVGASSSPICLTYAQNDAIDAMVDSLTDTAPALQFSTQDQVTQQLWRIDDPTTQQQLARLFEQVQTTYLTDGHHRAASGLGYARSMRERHGNRGDEAYNQLLVALFPDSQLNLLPFHRCVKDLNGKTVEQIVAELAPHFVVEPLPESTDYQCRGHHEFGMRIHNRWFRLQLKPGSSAPDDPVSSLDVSLLQNLILAPIFGITDARNNSRLDYVAGVSGASGIHQKQAEGWDVIFVCYPTSITQLMTVADTGGLMPPKSTYFDPKPRSGIFVRLK